MNRGEASLKILIVEDEKKLAEILKKGLEEHSFVVDLAFDGEEGLYMAETYTYDAIILDIMLPEVDGFTILNRLRTEKIDTPILVLTARGEIEDRVKGLNTGADDYIVKPFEFSELLARLKAIIRRGKGRASPVITVDDLTIDTNSRTVRRGDREIRLSAKEYSILEYLALNKGRIISRTELIDHVYDMNFDLNIIENAVRYNRKGGLVEVSAVKDDDRARITIKDTGMGIKEEDLGKIFNRFYRADISRNTEGTGLGLSIAKAAIEAHDGRIEVKSRINEGSSFFITLPL